jgi:hypothetical protein
MVAPAASNMDFATPRSAISTESRRSPGSAQQQVPWRDVTVDDVVGVQHIQRTAHLGAEPQRRYRVDALLAQVLQGAAVDVVHDEVRSPVIEGADVVHLHQTAIMDPAHDARLGEEAIADIGITGPVIGEHLDSHGHVQVVVMAEPHRRERPRADARYQPIPPYGVHRYHSRLVDESPTNHRKPPVTQPLKQPTCT